MLPTLMLAALVPCAVPGTDKEATAQMPSALLNGRWELVAFMVEGKARPIHAEVHYQFSTAVVGISSG